MRELQFSDKATSPSDTVHSCSTCTGLVHNALSQDDARALAQHSKGLFGSCLSRPYQPCHVCMSVP